MQNLNIKNIKNLIFLIFSFFCASTFATEIILLQAGKTFVRGIDEEKAKSIADNRDEIKKYSFDELKIKSGDTVEFRNVDSVKHNVFFDDLFNFIQNTGSKDKQVFKKPGTYEIKCAIHPKMKIKLVVE